MTRTIAVLSIVALLSACANQKQKPALQQIAPNTTVNLNVIEATAEPPDASANGATYAETIGIGAAAGASAGALVGFGMGLGCGPYFMVCGTALAVGGMMSGMVVGAGAGTLGAASLQLPRDKAEAFDEIINRTLADLDMSNELSSEFRAATASSWAYVDDEATVNINIVIEGVQLEKYARDRVSIATVTSLTVMTRAGDGFEIEKRVYRLDSGARHIDTWIWNDGATFRETIINQLLDHATTIAVELHESSRAPVGETSIVRASVSETTANTSGG